MGSRHFISGDCIIYFFRRKKFQSSGPKANLKKVLGDKLKMCNVSWVSQKVKGCKIWIYTCQHKNTDLYTKPYINKQDKAEKVSSIPTTKTCQNLCILRESKFVVIIIKNNSYSKISVSKYQCHCTSHKIQFTRNIIPNHTIFN